MTLIKTLNKVILLSCLLSITSASYSSSEEDNLLGAPIDELELVNLPEIPEETDAVLIDDDDEDKDDLLDDLALDSDLDGPPLLSEDSPSQSAANEPTLPESPTESVEPPES
jgi:hypothetical protein